MSDPFEVIGPIPSNVTYVWATESVEGQVMFGCNRRTLEAQGWKTVPRDRHPNMFGIDGQIRYGGQILMEKPK